MKRIFICEEVEGMRVKGQLLLNKYPYLLLTVTHTVRP